MVGLLDFLSWPWHISVGQLSESLTSSNPPLTHLWDGMTNNRLSYSIKIKKVLAYTCFSAWEKPGGLAWWVSEVVCCLSSSTSLPELLKTHKIGGRGVFEFWDLWVQPSPRSRMKWHHFSPCPNVLWYHVFVIEWGKKLNSFLLWFIRESWF